MTLTGTGIRRTWIWALLVTIVLVMAALGWNLLASLRALSLQDAAARSQALALGGEVRNQLAQGQFRQPPDVTVRKMPTSTHSPAGTMALRRISLLFAGRALWSVPPGAPPPFLPPPNGGEAVRWTEGMWVYGYTLPDGRLLLVSFDDPVYTRLHSQNLYMAAFQGAVMALVLLLVILLALRLYRSYRGLASTLADAGTLLPDQGPDAGTLAVVNVFQQTLKELRRRTDELEELHRRERRRAEDVEGLAEALCSNLEAGYLRFDQEGLLTGVNAAAKTLLALRDVPRLGVRSDLLLAERKDVLEVLAEVGETKSLVMKDEVAGAPGLMLQVAGIPLFNLLHQLRGYLLILRDFTSVYQMRKTLREREALTQLGEVAAGVAHEVRNALNTFTVRLRLIGQDVPGLSENSSYRALTEESRNLEQVMQNLLFYAKPLPLERETVSIGRLLNEAAATLIKSFPSLKVEVDCAPDLEAKADPEALGRALHNLARNAAEASTIEERPSGRVRLRGERTGESFRLAVEDDGPGVDPQATGELFTPFFSQKPGGTGLGLAIARKIAREHGGDLLYSPSDLGGACFVLILPDRDTGGGRNH
jgi:two-component system sensor histidine kinase FlrB